MTTIIELTETASNSTAEPNARKKPRAGALVAPVATKKPKSGKNHPGQESAQKCEEANGARDGSKAAKILDLLKRPGGATSKE